MIIMKATKVCGGLLSNGIFFSDIWFVGVKTTEKENEEEVDYYGTVKKIHKVFCLSMLESWRNNGREGLILL